MVNMAGYLESVCMVSCYLAIHSKAVKVILKEIEGKKIKSTTS